MKTIYSGGYIPNLALQDDKDKPMFGWLCYKHPDGQWVTLSGEYKNILTELTSARSRIEELEKAKVVSDNLAIEYRRICAEADERVEELKKALDCINGGLTPYRDSNLWIKDVIRQALDQKEVKGE